MEAMSDSTGLVVISFLGVMGYFLFYYVTRVTNDLGAEILTGVIRGNSISTKQRWFMLYNTWVSYVTGAVSMGIFLAIAQVLIGSSVGDENIRLLAYLAALVAAVGSLMWLSQGALGFLNYRSVLRQAEAD
jgi:hypothetical protein